MSDGATLTYRMTHGAPLPKVLAEQITRYTHCQAKDDPYRSDHEHGVIHVSGPASAVDRAARFWLEPIGVTYSVVDR